MRREAIDFDNLVKQVVDGPQVGQDDLAIWGGTCTEDKVKDFLAGWDLKEMPYRIWESTDRIDFDKNTTSVPNVALLERGRIFGAGGDLDLRRDGDGFRWRFVGDPDVRPPADYDVKENDFWAQDENQSAVFHCYEEMALLWGKREGKQKHKRWHDDRVAAAELGYPAPDGAQRVEVTYNVYSRAGRVEFVWLTGVDEWKEESDG